jgi:hypothetical protein
MKTLFFIASFLVFCNAELLAQDFSAENIRKTLSNQSSQRWVMFRQFQNGNDISSSVPICMADNVFLFTYGGNFQVSEGKLKCNPADPDELYSGTWSYTAENRFIRLLTGSAFVEWQITDIRENSIMLRAANMNEGSYEMEMRVLVE